MIMEKNEESVGVFINVVGSGLNSVKANKVNTNMEFKMDLFKNT